MSRKKPFFRTGSMGEYVELYSGLYKEQVSIATVVNRKTLRSKLSITESLKLAKALIKRCLLGL